MSAGAPCIDELRLDSSTALDTVIMLLMFMSLAAACNTNDMKIIFTRPKAVILILIGQYALMPFLAYLFGKAGDLSPSFKIAFIIALAAPGGAISNMIAGAYQADIEMSIGATAISCILAVGFMPLNQVIYIMGSDLIPPGSNVCIKFVGIIWAAAIVVIAILLGIFLKFIGLRYRWFRFIKVVYYIGGIAGLVLIIKSIVGNATSAIPWWEMPGHQAACIVAPAFIGPPIMWLIGTLFRIPGPTRLVMFLEAGIQNMPVSMAAISFVLPPQDIMPALAIPMLYQIAATIFLIVWSYFAWKLGYTNMPKDKNFIAAFREARRKANERERAGIYGTNKDAFADDATAEEGKKDNKVLATNGGSHESQSADENNKPKDEDKEAQLPVVEGKPVVA